mgnify:CR=1 FL=1
MAAVDQLIGQRLSSSVPLVGQVAQHIISSGGKRLRPVLLLLTAGALGYKGEDHFKLAAVVEFIHTATLLHDDVVDDSGMRRGKATANALFGNPASVLVGDFLYSRAFQMMVECGEMRILDIVADATNVIAEGEVMQLMNMHDASLNQQDYLKVIRSKTAKLFEASTRLPAVLVQSSAKIEAACAAYGQALGTAFQVIDDVLDYDGDAADECGIERLPGGFSEPRVTAFPQSDGAFGCDHGAEQAELDLARPDAVIVEGQSLIDAERSAAGLRDG